MKRKIILLVIAIISPFLLFAKPEEQSSALTFDVIPDEAIRLRILANSDSAEDQKIKDLVRDRVSEQINEWVGEMTNIEEARAFISDNIPVLEVLISDLLQDIAVDQNVEMEYHSQVSFPMKLYDSIIYPAGEYEAVLITLGEGEGANWWCVLFPPLCFLDFNHGSTVASEASQVEIEEKEEEEKEVKVKFFLLKWLGLS